MSRAEIEAFWANARVQARLLHPAGGQSEDWPREVPDAWAFGGSPEQADEALTLVLRGVKTATASAVWDYEHEGEELPHIGKLTIILDGDGRPGALIQTTEIAIVPFDAVGLDHVVAEAEGDLTVEHWREVHEWFFRENSSSEQKFAPDMPVVLERFVVVHPAPARV